MRRSKAIMVFIIAIVAVGATTASADLINGGFESGGLAGWDTSGNWLEFAVDWEFPRDFSGPQPVPTTPHPFVPGIAAWLPVEGNYFASLWSTDGFMDSAMLSQDFTVDMDDLVLSFDYFFDQYDPMS